MRYHWPFRVTSARCLSGFTIVSYNKQLSSSVITAFGRLRQEDHEFEAILGLKPFWRPCLIKKVLLAKKKKKKVLLDMP
jgi:hypothetical protein